MRAANEEASPNALRRKRGLSACEPPLGLRRRPLQCSFYAARKRGNQQRALKRRFVGRGIPDPLHPPYPPRFVGKEEGRSLARCAEGGFVAVERRFGNLGKDCFKTTRLPAPGHGYNGAVRCLDCRCQDITRAQGPDANEREGAVHHGLVESPGVTLPELLAPVAG